MQDTPASHSSHALLSLFCGPGGLDQGFKDCGFVTKLAYDIDPAGVRTHRRNHVDANARVADLSKLQVDDIVREWKVASPDASPVGVLGGPPCQSFSVSNVHQKADDPRDDLPRHYARILKGLNDEFALDFFVFENVPGLLGAKHVEKYRQFKDLFRECGFDIYETVLDAQDFGVAQVRKRVFIVGLNRSKYSLPFRFPSPSGDIALTVRGAIGHLPEPTPFERGLKPADIAFHPNHWYLQPRSAKFKQSADALRKRKNKGRSFRCLDWDKPSYTVAYGHREVHVHPDGGRRLSVLEALCLQGFPSHYVLEGTLSDQLRLVSEAVPAPLSAAIASELVEQLGLNCQQTAPANDEPSPKKKRRLRQGVLSAWKSKGV